MDAHIMYVHMHMHMHSMHPGIRCFHSLISRIVVYMLLHVSREPHVGHMCLLTIEGTTGHGSKSRTPVNIPIPTKIGSKMGGDFTYPKLGSQSGFDNHSQMRTLKPTVWTCQQPRGV